MSPIYVCGPTASGKTALALRLAREHDGEVVNADAFQLFRGLEIVSAAPSAEERAVVPHHLFGVLAPTSPNDAHAYAEMARPVIADILRRGKTPIVTGGSGLYLKFLTHGSANVPPADPQLRELLESRTLEDLVAELQSLDPAEATRTNLQNRRYVSRALEICLLSGQRASDLRDRWEHANRETDATLTGFVIRRPRAELHERIARRTRAMLDGGAIDEVAALSGVSTHCEKAIGFREICRLLDGEIDRATCEELINAATRQYAKRQETWFKREQWLVELGV